MEEAWEESYHPAAPSSSAASSSTSFWPGHYTALLPPVPGGVGAGSVPMSWGFPEDRAMWLSQAWDEEYSMAAELEEEMQIEPPGPADLPLPFGTAAELTMNNTEHGHEAAVVDWLELVRDKRVLRGGRLLGCVVERRTGEPTFSTSSSSSSAASSSSTSPWDGEGATRDDVQLGTSPGSSTTSAPPTPTHPLHRPPHLRLLPECMEPLLLLRRGSLRGGVSFGLDVTGGTIRMVRSRNGGQNLHLFPSLKSPSPETLWRSCPSTL